MLQKCFIVTFWNKGMGKINLNRILKSEGSITHLPRKMQLQENIHVATCWLTPAKRNKILQCTVNHCRC